MTGFNPKTALTLLRTRLTQAGLEYEDDDGTLKTQCPVCNAPGKPLTITPKNGQMFACLHGCDHEEIIAAIKTARDVTAPLHGVFNVKWTDDKTPKLILPDIPKYDDYAALAAWTTSVLRLDTNHPVTSATHHGITGQDGHVELRRHNAFSLQFEPAAVISTARRLLPVLSWQLLPTDDEPYGFKDDHCRRIAHVIHRLCGAAKAPTQMQETTSIIGAYLQIAEPVTGYTLHGTVPQRYEAAIAMRAKSDGNGNMQWGQKYLVDSVTGELAIRVSDLLPVARQHTGGTVAHGWLDGRISTIGWQRRMLDGRAEPGREGRSSPHVRFDVYVGSWPVATTIDELLAAAVR